MSNILGTVDGHRAWEAGMASMERVLRAVVCRDVSAFDLAIHEHAVQMDNLRELLSPDGRPTLRTQALSGLRSALADMVSRANNRRHDDEIAGRIDRVQAEAALKMASKAGI